MSFIYDNKNLLNELFKAGQAPQNNQVIDLAKKLIQNLQIESSGGTVFTAERADADLDQVDLVDLDSLFNFLWLNGIKANSKTLVFKAQNFDLNQLGEDAKLYFAYPTEDPVYYVNKGGLAAYLNDLKNKSVNNPLFSANINRLLQRVNTDLPDVMKPEKKTPHTEVAGPSDQDGTVEPVALKDRQKGGPTTQDLRKLLGKLPLLEDRIDFQRIKFFVQAYTQITGQSGGALDNINAELNKMSTNFKVGPAQGFPINSDEIARVLPKDGQTTPYAYVSSLYSLITNVKQVLNYLKSASYDQMDDQLKEQLDQQVGTGANDGNSIAYQNLAELQDAMREAKDYRRTT